MCLSNDVEYDFNIASIYDYVKYFTDLKVRFKEYRNLRIYQECEGALVLWGDILETDAEYAERKKQEEKEYATFLALQRKFAKM